MPTAESAVCLYVHTHRLNNTGALCEDEGLLATVDLKPSILPFRVPFIAKTILASKIWEYSEHLGEESELTSPDSPCLGIFILVT